MIITMSPAMLLDFDKDISISKSTIPMYSRDAKILNDLLTGFSMEELAKLMKVNPDIAREAYLYIHSFNSINNPECQAAVAYNGIAYQGLDIGTMSSDDLDFAQLHLVILSGLYGMLKPLDLIEPHRLEMQTKLANPSGKTLFDYWRPILTAKLAEMMRNDSNVWVNLSSDEYFKVIDRKGLPKGAKIISPIFKEVRGDDYKQVVVYTKKARGMMSRFIIQHRLSDPEHLKAFDTEGYNYSQHLSSDDEWVFIR